MKEKKLLKLIVLLVITLSVIKLLIAGLISTSGFTLFNLKREIQAVNTENQHLQEEIVSHSSFKNIQAQAETLGFRSVKMVLNYTVARSSIAMKE